MKNLTIAVILIVAIVLVVPVVPVVAITTDHRVGSLKVGKDADIVIYDGDPLQIRSTVVATIIDGRRVWPK